MNEEVKKLIESVEVFSPMAEPDDSWVSKSDFDQVVEELTKWNKVEDGLPEKQGYYFVRVKNSFPKNCNIIVCEFYEDNHMFYSESGDDPIYDATEWTYIF